MSKSAHAAARLGPALAALDLRGVAGVRAALWIGAELALRDALERARGRAAHLHVRVAQGLAERGRDARVGDALQHARGLAPRIGLGARALADEVARDRHAA